MKLLHDLKLRMHVLLTGHIRMRILIALDADELLADHTFAISSVLVVYNGTTWTFLVWAITKNIYVLLALNL